MYERYHNLMTVFSMTEKRGVGKKAGGGDQPSSSVEGNKRETFMLFTVTLGGFF
jgi:hypothetical protein